MKTRLRLLTALVGLTVLTETTVLGGLVGFTGGRHVDCE